MGGAPASQGNEETVVHFEPQQQSQKSIEQCKKGVRGGRFWGVTRPGLNARRLIKKFLPGIRAPKIADTNQGKEAPNLTTFAKDEGGGEWSSVTDLEITKGAQKGGRGVQGRTENTLEERGLKRVGDINHQTEKESKKRKGVRS